MYKPAFWLLIFLHSTAMVSAQGDEPPADSFSAVEEQAAPKDGGYQPFEVGYEQKPVALRTVPKRIVDSLKADDAFWYANAAPAKKKEKETSATGSSLFQKRWFRNLLWSLILISFLGVLVWYLISSNLFVFRKKSALLHREDEGGAIGDDIFSIDYDSEIAAATTRGQYRLAVRLWYLQTLKFLAEKELIDYRDGRTNQDYVAQLSRHAGYRDFFRLTRHFEYTWYGQFSLSADAYQLMRDDFLRFQKSLS